jgi:glutathione S-transferase
MASTMRESDEAKKAELQRKLAEETVPVQMAIFESRLAKTGSGYLVPSGLTFADLYLTLVIDWLGDKKEAALANFPHLKQLTHNVNTHPKIAAWIARRPVTPM